jgi:Tol biopolymer transport system component
MIGLRSATCLGWLTVATLCFSTPAAQAQSAAAPSPTFSERITSLGRIEAGETLYPISLKVSDDNFHIAYAAKNPKGMFAAFDSQRGAYAKAVAKGTPLISRGQSHWAYIAYGEQQKAQAVVDLKPEPPFDGIDAFGFSPDGARWAYRAGMAGKQAVVVNGAAQTPFDLIDIRTGPLFSPDGRRLAYGAMNGKEGALVVDGTPVTVDGAVEQIVFSPDAKRLAYVLKKDKQLRVMVDDQPGPIFQKISAPTFSPDSRRFAYMAQKSSAWVAVVDGKEMIGGDSVGTPLFSADSRRLAYAAHTGKEWYMVVDGKKGRRFDQLGISMFSPDSSRLAYMAQTKERACMVVDDQMGPIFDSVGEPVFSPDSRQLAYRSRKGDKWFVVQNGRAHEAIYDGLRRPVFSPDGAHLAYVAIEGQEMIMVLDERPLSRHDSVTFPFFSPGGTHLAYAGCTKDQWRVYVDGAAGQNFFDATLKDGTITFDGENQCRMIALKMPGPEFLRLDIQIDGNPGP